MSIANTGNITNINLSKYMQSLEQIESIRKDWNIIKIWSCGNVCQVEKFGQQFWPVNVYDDWAVL